MSLTFDLDVTVLIGAPLEPWSTGKLQLELSPGRFEGASKGTATGSFTIDRFSDPFSVTGPFEYDVDAGGHLDVQGETDQAIVEIVGVFAIQDIGDNNNYVGGVLELFDKSGDEWIYYVLNGAQAN